MIDIASAGSDRLDDRYDREKGRVLLSGTQALVRLALEQRRGDIARGLNTAGFVSGYRGSPLGGLDREFMRAGAMLAAHHIVFRPGVNEDLAATAIWGSQQLELFDRARYDGVFAMWYGKGPGVDRSMDAIRHAHAAGSGTNGGVLLLVGDDHGAASSTLPHQSDHNLISAMMPLLSPAGVGEFVQMGLLGFAMSRYAGLWVGFKCQTEIVESTSSVDLDSSATAIVVPPPPSVSLAPRWPDAPLAMERRLMDDKMAAVAAFARANAIDRVTLDAPGATRGIVASGKAWLDLMGALDLLGIDVPRAHALGLRLYKVGLVWPLEEQGLRRFASGLDTLLVVEEKRPVIEDQLRAILYNAPARPVVLGKTDTTGAVLLPAWGEIDPLMVARAVARLVAPACDAALAAFDAQAPALPALAPIIQREAYFCSGCPHSVSTRLPEGSRATTGVGCHAMVVGLPERATATLAQMGGEGVAWTGLAPFTDEPHIFVNMGDGTYYHSGLLAIRAAISAGVNATYKILFNDAVAMTGGQPHDGPLSVASIVDQVLAEGAVRVAVVAEEPERWTGLLPRGVTLNGRDDLDSVQRDLRDISGVTVIVYDQVCAAEKRRRRKRGAFPVGPRRAFINDLVCEGCGDCSAVSNCISIEPIETEFGRKRTINQSSCNTDLSCVKGFCPSFVTIEGGRPRKGATGTLDQARLAADVAALAEPDFAPLDHTCAILMTGVGGTGVVTVSAILAQAAHLDGKAALALDQTGFAQKNGAVASHLKIATAPAHLNAPRIGRGECDVLLGFDMVVASGGPALSTMAPGQTRAVLEGRVAPTAGFVKDNALDFRRATLLRAITDATGRQPDTLDATDLATRLFGDAIAANMLLVGFAWQRGLIPIGRDAIMRAIKLNGAGAAMNASAFACGRLAAQDAAYVRRMAGLEDAPDDAPPPLEALVERRVAFLIDYQDAAYAARYRALVARAQTAEQACNPGTSSLAEAVARTAFKLMAYKDEYEVARLHADAGFAQKLDAAFEGPINLRFHLAPPLLSRIDPRTGAPAKIALGAWMLPVFRVLAKLKGLRGTRLDPFGYTAERRMERALVEDYFAEVDDLCAQLTPARHAASTALLALPQEIRGYGHVKHAALARAQDKRTAIEARLQQPASLGAGDTRLSLQA